MKDKELNGYIMGPDGRKHALGDLKGLLPDETLQSIQDILDKNKVEAQHVKKIHNIISMITDAMVGIRETVGLEDFDLAIRTMESNSELSKSKMYGIPRSMIPESQCQCGCQENSPAGAFEEAKNFIDFFTDRIAGLAKEEAEASKTDEGPISLPTMAKAKGLKFFNKKQLDQLAKVVAKRVGKMFKGELKCLRSDIGEIRHMLMDEFGYDEDGDLDIYDEDMVDYILAAEDLTGSTCEEMQRASTCLGAVITEIIKDCGIEPNILSDPCDRGPTIDLINILSQVQKILQELAPEAPLINPILSKKEIDELHNAMMEEKEFNILDYLPVCNSINDLLMEAYNRGYDVNSKEALLALKNEFVRIVENMYSTEELIGSGLRYNMKGSGIQKMNAFMEAHEIPYLFRLNKKENKWRIIPTTI